MKRPVFFLFILCLLVFCGRSQNMINVKEKNFPYSLEKVTGSPLNAFKLLEPYKSCYLELKPDGSFLFYDINSLGFHVCLGKYSINKPFVRLTWDSIPTYQLVRDSLTTAKLFKYKKPVPFKAIPAVYLIKEKGLESLTLKYDKIEFLFSSDLNKKEPLLDSLTGIQYATFHQKQILVKRHHRNDMVFKKDSVWGFRIYKDGAFKTFRNDTAVLKWNMFPGYQVAQIEKGLVIYLVENSTKTFYYYFSKTLDSEIFPINKLNLTREYSHLPGFLDEVQKEFKLGLNYGNINEATHNFRLIELYRAALTIK